MCELLPVGLFTLSEYYQIAIGFAWSLLAGHLLVEPFHRWQQGRLRGRKPDRGLQFIINCFCCWRPLGRTNADDDDKHRIPACLTGLIERLVFTPVVWFDPSNAVLAMGAWITLKMAANWNKDAPSKFPDI